jgi:predicted transcriptional regulator
MAILFVIVGLFGIPGWFAANPFLLFIALFVYIGAGQEASMTETRIAMQGLPVRHAMMTRFRVLSPQDSLQTAADELMAGAQQDFPVAEGSKVVGMLRREDLFRALREQDHHSLVGSVMTRDCPTVSENEMLEAVFRRMQHDGCSSLPVVSGDRVVGLITLENIGEMLMIRQARGGLASPQGDALV